MRHTIQAEHTVPTGLIVEVSVVHLTRLRGGLGVSPTKTLCVEIVLLLLVRCACEEALVEEVGR